MLTFLLFPVYLSFSPHIGKHVYTHKYVQWYAQYVCAFKCVQTCSCLIKSSLAIVPFLLCVEFDQRLGKESSLKMGQVLRSSTYPSSLCTVESCST